MSVIQADEIVNSIKKSIIDAHPEISKIILETASSKEKSA
jgi:hypothetical protein